MMRLFGLIICLSCFAFIQADSLKIIQKRLPYYCSAPRTKAVRYVMLHYTSDALENPTNPMDVDKVLSIFKRYKVSAHYLIDREGTIYSLVDESRIAFHAGKGYLPHDISTQNSLNGQSIGIELLAVGTQTEMQKLGVINYPLIPESAIGFTEGQYQSLKQLLAQLAATYPDFQLNCRQVVGHDTYAPERRGDPGQLFDWQKLELPN
jgi:N-acetyl-anhydromuramyl-L-alanine amidase AmpD